MRLLKEKHADPGLSYSTTYSERHCTFNYTLKLKFKCKLEADVEARGRLAGALPALDAEFLDMMDAYIAELKAKDAPERKKGKWK